MANEAPSSSNLTMGRLILYVLLLSLGGVILFKYYQNKGLGFSSIPKEMQINYLPADFKINIDEDRALEILANPEKNRKEFNQLVYDLNISILNHVANRMGLTESQKQQARDQYEAHHSYLRNLYYQDFLQLKDTTSNLYQTWYENEGSSSSKALREVASKYTCFMVNHIFMSILPSEGGSIYAKGMEVETPCGVAMQEALQPMMQRLEERGAIRDFSRSRGLMQEKVERVIAELATMEVRDKKGLSKNLQTKIWGFSVSSTNIEVSAISILKVGFKIDQYFDINLNSRSGIVTVSLPEATILSHEVYPKFDKLDIGWLREVKDADLNKAFNALRAEFRREALESDIRNRAEAQAVELMNTMFSPLLNSLNSRYQLKVVFKKTEESAEEPEITASDFSN